MEMEEQGEAYNPPGVTSYSFDVRVETNSNMVS